jgi:GDP-4-dehydro-6-deoxy-D-mannose reductase
MRVLITGANGFVGVHLSRALQRAGHEVVALSGPGGPEPHCDLRDGAAVRKIVSNTRPTAVVHLAAVSSVAASHQEPGRTVELNVGGTLNLLEGLRREAPSARLVLVGSGEMYGASLGRRPAREDDQLIPLSPYAASKVSAEVLGFQYARSYGLDVVCARPFTHLGSGQAASFAVPSFARQVAAIKSGRSQARVSVGNLDVVRDILHVDDVVAAYVLLLNAGQSGRAYNIASGSGRTMRSLLDGLIAAAKVSVEVWVDPERVRPVEIPEMIGDASRLGELGWTPALTVEAALSDVLKDAFNETAVA